jgi:hypothetical protein
VFQSPFTGTQSLSFKSKAGYTRHIPRWCSARSLPSSARRSLR